MQSSPTSTDVLTIEEAATVLRISRGAAYALARRWRETGGCEGIPCLQLGRTLRVPSDALHEMLEHPNPPSAGRHGGTSAVDDRADDVDEGPAHRIGRAERRREVVLEP